LKNKVSDVFKIRYPFIRPMLPTDLDPVIRIEEQSFPHPWTRDQFMSELQRESVSRCHIAVMGDHETYPVQHASPGEGSVVGFIMAWLVADELHITNLAVAPEARRCGVAAALLEQSIREAVEVGAVWCQLEVKVSNTPARGLYRLFGFKPLGIRKGYYHNGEDAVVMGRDLKPESSV
jgi:ribosomal-protein-alanine N-acetyltransferase